MQFSPAAISRPGGNITGVTILAPELSAKRLEVLRDIIPGLSRVTALHDPTNGTSQVTMAESAARALNVKLQVLDIKNRDDVARAIRAARDTQAQALNVFFSPLLSSLHREIITLAAEYGLPAIYQWKEHAEAGGWYPMGPVLPRYGGSPQSSWPRFSRALSLPTYQSSNPRSSSWH